MDSDDVVREQLLQLLGGGNAHMNLDRAITDFPMKKINSTTPPITYSPWHLLEHIRIAQWDILEFIRNPDHVSPAWPEGYWPPKGKLADRSDWERTIEAIRSDRSALEAIVKEPGSDLYADLPHADDYTILREILVVSDHNAYHLGEFGILRGLLEV